MTKLSPPVDPAETAAIELVATSLHGTLHGLHKSGHRGATYEAVGGRCGVPKQHVGEWCNALSGRSPKLHKIVRMGPTIAPSLLRALAAAVESSALGKPDLLHAVLRTQGSTGDLAKIAGQALADGELDATEDAQLDAALLQMEADIASVRAAKAALRARRGGR